MNFQKTHLGDDEVLCDYCGQLIDNPNECVVIRSPASTIVLHAHRSCILKGARGKVGKK
jgi:hypothetical protein